MWVSHVFLTYSFADRLPLFPCLGCGEDCCRKRWVCISLFDSLFSFPLDIYPEVGLLDHMVVSFLIFWETSTSSSIVTEPVYSPTNSAHGLPFPHIFANTQLATCRLATCRLDNSHSYRCEFISLSHCGFVWFFLAVPLACRVLVHWSGIEPRPWQWKRQVLNPNPWTDKGILFVGGFDLHFSDVAQWWRTHLPCRRCRFNPWVRKILWRRI